MRTTIHLDECIVAQALEIRRLEKLLAFAEQDACQLRNIGPENILKWHDAYRELEAIKAKKEAV